jgi:hypothetical protein
MHCEKLALALGCTRVRQKSCNKMNAEYGTKNLEFVFMMRERIGEVFQSCFRRY